MFVCRPDSVKQVLSDIFAKATGTRVEKYLSDIIYKDQSGFIKNRSSMNNLSRLFYIMSEAESLKDTPVIASLDAEKVSDHVEWCYMFKVLEHFSFANYFINCVRVCMKNLEPELGPMELYQTHLLLDVAQDRVVPCRP